jgi:glycosyltransferase involved in cell wall biosynthesis
VARWDPDKRWLLAIDTVGELKRHGWRPLLIARGGVEKHGEEVLARAGAVGLRVVEHASNDPGPEGLLASLDRKREADVISLRSPLSADACRVLYRAVDAVLANSGHEPFGLVGLEAMAAGGLACTGSTGEDYAVAGWNALVLQTADPQEFLRHFRRLQFNPAEARAIRQRGVLTARQYVWHEIVRRNLLPHLQPPGGAAAMPPERPRRSGRGEGSAASAHR